MSKQRLDRTVAARQLTGTRSQAESYIKLGRVEVNGEIVDKPGFLVADDDDIRLTGAEQYVSRAGLKLASVSQALHLDFSGKTVLDVGSSTGGFTDYALHHGAARVIAVDVGTEQLHASLRTDPRVELHEKTDIRDFSPDGSVDIVLIDVSFISLREILPAVVRIIDTGTRVVAMVKPQFEAAHSNLKHKGVVKNDRMRRDILDSFEGWAMGRLVIVDKADSQVSGAKGNRERFYLLQKA